MPHTHHTPAHYTIYHLPPTHIPTQGEEDESADLKVRDDGTTLEQLIVSQTNNTKVYSLVVSFSLVDLHRRFHGPKRVSCLKHQITLLADHANILQ